MHICSVWAGVDVVAARAGMDDLGDQIVNGVDGAPGWILNTCTIDKLRRQVPDCGKPRGGGPRSGSRQRFYLVHFYISVVEVLIFLPLR
jgi:hypothetical protein